LPQAGDRLDFVGSVVTVVVAPRPAIVVVPAEGAQPPAAERRGQRGGDDEPLMRAASA
jgi:hypothetical protein